MADRGRSGAPADRMAEYPAPAATSRNDAANSRKHELEKEEEEVEDRG